jgi:hypothetical protein
LKAVKLLLVLVFALIPFNSAFAAEKPLDAYFPMDMDIEEHWAYDEMEDLINADIVDGFLNSDNEMYVKPKENITRAQFVKIIVTALGLKSNGAGKTFPDVKTGVWYSEPIQIASSLGIIEGTPDGTFGPNKNITRAEMTKVIVNSFEKTIQFPSSGGKTFTDVSADYWATEFISKAAAAEIVNGYGNEFKPKNLATRAEAMVMIHRALHQEQSNLPADEEIKAFLTDHIKRENAIVEAGKFEELTALYEENGTGYYRAEGVELGGAMFPGEGEEVTITIEDENLNLDVLGKADRFVTVEATGMMITVVYKSDGFNMDFTTEMDGIYDLKKDPVSGDWKIYSYYPLFAEEEF